MAQTIKPHRTAFFLPTPVRLILCIGIAAVTVSPLPANENTPANSRWYTLLRDAVYNHDTTEQTAAFYYHQGLQALSSITVERHLCLYRRARIEYLFGRILQDEEKKSEAAIHYQKAVEHIDSALNDAEFSEGYRLKSEVMPQMCFVKGFGYSLVHGSKIVPLAETALELQGIDKDDRFNIYSSIGIAYHKLDCNEKALSWLEKSLEIYPGNRFINRDYNKIKAKVSKS